MERNIREATLALIEKPIRATSAERFLILDEIKSDCPELVQPKRFSRALSILLSRVSLPMEPYDRIAGRVVDRELCEEEEARFQAYLKHPDYPAHNLFLSSGHCTYSWGTLLERGLPGLRAQALARRNRATDDRESAFAEAMVEIYDAIISFALRYADVAQSMGKDDVACNLRRIATAPPDSFSSALQLLWLVTLINCAYVSENPTLTVGRLDQLLYPYYQADLKSGRTTREDVAKDITDYYCKHNLIMGRGEHQVGDETNSTTFARIPNFDAPQYLLLGGTDENGDLAVNELTELMAECIVPAFKNPVVVVRYVTGMDQTAPNLWRTLCDRALAASSLMFYNDGNVISAFERLGLPKADARQYAHFGCNWCSPGERGVWMQAPPKSVHMKVYQTDEETHALNIPFMRTNTPHAYPEDLMLVLRELAKKDPDSLTIDDVYDGLLKRLSEFIDRKLSILSRELSVRKRNPWAALTFGDCFLTDVMESGQTHSVCATYHFELQPFQMFGTVVDSIIAIDKLVIREKRLTLSELLRAVDADFEGFPELLALCRNADKYGMDTPFSNAHVARLSKAITDTVIQKCHPYFEKERLFLVPCFQSDTWHLKMGEDFGATPDGRRAHTPFSQNTRPSNGACKNGLTAMFNSMLHLPKDGLVSGALNLDVDAKQFVGESGHAIFASLLATYFNRGGLHAQVSCTTLEDLLDARKNPSLHRDIRVRVTGYSGVFVDICDRLQDDIIERFQ